MNWVKITSVILFLTSFSNPKTGYSRNISGLAIALAEKGVDVKVIQNQDNEFIDERAKPLMEYDIQKATKEIDDTTIVMGRTYANIHEAVKFKPKMVCAILVLEGDRLPQDWIAKANLIDQVWASSNYNKEMLIKNGCACDIQVIHHGFWEDIYYPKNEDCYNDGKEPLKILFVGGYTCRGDRKGADLLAEAFNVFNKDDNVKLTFKINTTYNPNFDARGDLLSIIKPELHEKVEFITDFLDDKEIAELYRTADVSVTPTLGEAFCQSILEAMACGTPCIVTSYSGHLDYCNEDNSWLIHVEKPMLAHYGGFDISSGSVWRKPSVEHLKKILEQCYYYPEDMKKKGIEATKVLNSLTWNHAALDTVKAIKNYLKEYK